MNSIPPSPLDYAPPPGWHRRPAIRLIATMLFIGIVAMLFASRNRILQSFDDYRANWRLVEQQNELLGWHLGPDAVMHEEDPEKVVALLQTDQPFRTIEGWNREILAVQRKNESWSSLQRLMDGSSNPLVYAHARKSPDGDRRLVVVAFGTNFGPDVRHSMVYPYIIVAGSKLGRAPKRAAIPANGLAIPLSILSTDEDEWRWFAGTTDPADPSHFTISYEFNDVPGMIDGWLRDDDSVIVWPREGHVEWDSKHGFWLPIWHPPRPSDNAATPAAATAASGH